MITSEAQARDYARQWASEAQLNQLEELAQRLIAENAKQNLISKRSESQIWKRHIADSIQLLEHVPGEIQSTLPQGIWLDLGSGAGFPGLVIAILRPQWRMICIESRKRRVEWLESVSRDFNLRNVQILGRRLEVVEPFAAQVISARAFAPLAKLLALSAPFSTSSTHYILPKGLSASEELAGLPQASREKFHVEHSLTDTQAGIIVSKRLP